MGRAAWISRQIPKNLDSLQRQTAHAPAVFVVSDDDQVVPPPYQERVIAAYAEEKKQIVRVAGAGHGSPISGGAAIELQQGSIGSAERQSGVVQDNTLVALRVPIEV